MPTIFPKIDDARFAAGQTAGVYPTPIESTISRLGKAPITPVDLRTLIAGDKVAVLLSGVPGELDLFPHHWIEGTVVRTGKLVRRTLFSIELDVGDIQPRSVGVQETQYATNPDKWVYLKSRMNPETAEGLSMVSSKYKLPYEITGSIAETLTGKKPARFRPDSKSGGTKRAKGRKYRKRAGRPSTRRVHSSS